MPGARRARRAVLENRAIRRAAVTPRAAARLRRPGARVDEFGAIADPLALVQADRQRSVVILAHPTQRGEVRHWLDELAGDHLHVVSGKEVAEWGLLARGATFHKARGLQAIDLELKRIGTIDVLVSLLPADLIPGESHDQYTLFQRFFRYVARGGAYVVDRAAAPTSSALLGTERWTTLLAAAEDPTLAQDLPRRDVDLAESTGTVLLSRDLIIATKRFDHLVKLREADVEPVLGPREPDLTMTVLSRRRAREFASRATVTSHGDLVPQETFPQKFTIPALTVRRYEGQIGSPGGTLLYTGRTVLPDSFRWHLASNPKNVRLVASVLGFSRLESRYVPRRRLAGNYYSLDSSHSGHFGHLTTEVVARLWGWDRAKQEMPDLKALFHLKPGTKRHPQLEIDLLTAYGIPEEDIVWVNEPVWLDSVASSTPMWHNEDPHYVDPDIVSTWDRLTDGLLARAPAVEPHQRLFISRRVSNRTCRNRAAVEEFFTSRGYHVVFPEVLSLPEQVALFAGARVIAGFAGSNMFNLMHARKLEAMIVLSHDGYIARNEHLFSAVRGGEAHYFWSRASIPQPDGGYSKEAFHSEWDFDFEANGKELDEVVTRLG